MCRTYGWTVEYVLNAKAVHMAMMYRCFAQGEGRLDTTTLGERELMERRKEVSDGD